MADIDSERQETAGLEDYLSVIRSRAWLIALVVVVVVVVAGVISFTTTSLYQSSASLIYGKNNMDSAVFGTELFGYDYDRARTIETAITVIGRNQSIAEAVKAQLGSSRSAEELSGMVSASADAETDLVTIEAVSPDPNEAVAVADAFADQFILYRQNADRAAVATAREGVKQQLDSLPADELKTDYGLMLQEKYETLRILESMQDGGFTSAGRASVSSAPFTPQPTRNMILALVVGLVLGIGLAFLLDSLDKRIKDEKTLEQALGVPVLARVPALSGRWKTTKPGQRSGKAVGFEGSSAVLIESFRTLRSSLQYFDVDGGLSTILITSGLPQEGKTTTTINLGFSLALSGKRVIVLEADLRRPMVNEYLTLDNEVGLSSVLAGVCSVPDALQMVRLDDFIPAVPRKGQGDPSTKSLGKNLYCLASGPVPPNPAELLGSARMGHVISELKEMADYVLIDTPPLLLVSDALTLAKHVDALILTARLHATTREEAGEVRTLLGRAGVRVIGVVAGGFKTRRGYYYNRHGYGYGYGYGHGYGESTRRELSSSRTVSSSPE